LRRLSAPDLFPLDELRDDRGRRSCRAAGEAVQYGPTRGHAPLVDALVDEMARGTCAVTSEDLLVTTGSQQGLDLVRARARGPDDAVLVEAPTFTGAISAFGNARPRWIAGVRQDDHGIDLERSRAGDGRGERGHRPKLLYVVPNFQNPTGKLLPQDGAARCSPGPSGTTASSSKTTRTARSTSRARCEPDAIRP
jgi:2-aminoadipate transaminase